MNMLRISRLKFVTISFIKIRKKKTNIKQSEMTKNERKDVKT